MTIASPPGTATAPDWKKDADEQVAVLEAHKDEWAAMPVPARLEYLEAIRRRTHDSGRRWVEAAARAKGLAPDSELVGEEWASGPWALIFGLNRYLETLREIDRQGAPRLDRRDVRTRPDGQVVVKVFPNGLMDNLLLNGIRGEVWMEPGISADSVANEMGAAYKQRPEHGAVALVLGAGNIASIAPMDVLHKLVHEHSVVLLKMHPVNDYLGPVFEDIFQPLIRDGFMAITSGGVDAGEYLVNHPGIEELHMTGSDRTHDAIVWGTGAEAAERKKQGTPLNPRRMTSELGNVTPMIVVPGPWDEQDIRFQADHIATTKLHNAGFNCIGTQVLVMPEGWDRADALVRAVREAMSDAPARKPYYPGAGDRQRQIAEGHPAAEVLDADATEAPRTLVTGLDSTDPDESCFRQECFASVLVTTSVGGNDAADYLDRAVDFANGRRWGNLGRRSSSIPRP